MAGSAQTTMGCEFMGVTLTQRWFGSQPALLLTVQFTADRVLMHAPVFHKCAAHHITDVSSSILETVITPAIWKWY